MKFPAHIILEISNLKLQNNSFNYWKTLYLENTELNLFIIPYYTTFKHFSQKNFFFLNTLTVSFKKFTVKKQTQRFANLVKFSSILTKKKKKKLLKRKTFKFLHLNLNNVFLKFFFLHKNVFFLNTTFKFFLFDINFLKKEKIYTKLKYSRVPQYDIISGGSAALFAGFLGFLICEKFGFELLDSGDFYVLFMYLVFFFFFCKTFLKLITADISEWSVLSVKYLMNYLKFFFFFTKNAISRIKK